MKVNGDTEAGDSTHRDDQIPPSSSFQHQRPESAVDVSQSG